MKIKQHVPSFFEGLKPKKIEFKSEEEFFNIDFINSWMQNSRFKRFSISGDKLLIAEMKDNSYWVVGYLCGENFLTFTNFKYSRTLKGPSL